MKLHLSVTHYGDLLTASAEDGDELLTVPAIEEKIRDKLLLEFKYIRNHSVPPLSTFLDYMTSVQANL